MNATTIYGKLNKQIEAIASGYAGSSVNGLELTIRFINGDTQTIVFPAPKDGKGIDKIEKTGTNDDGDVYTIYYDDGETSEFVVGRAPDGFSPIITENANNTDEVYMLDIETADGIFTTPNLKGLKGSDGTMTFEDLTDEQKESLKGDQGDPGFSPTITENENNTDEVYMLDIETVDGTFTTPNLKGISGDPGFDPTITENVDNTEDVYKLDIETVDGTFTTPNLKGTNGEQGDPGFSPIITENIDNSEDVYALDIEIADGSFTTPNLKGANGKSAYDIWLEQGNVGTEEEFIESLKGGGSNVTVDDTLDITSENAIQNKVVAEKLEEIDERLEELGSEPQGYEHYIKITGEAGYVNYLNLQRDIIEGIFTTGEPNYVKNGWTINSIESDSDTLIDLSILDALTDKQITSTPEGLSIESSSLKVEDDITEGELFELLYEWNDFKPKAVVTYNSIAELKSAKTYVDTGNACKDILNALDLNEELVLINEYFSDYGLNYKVADDKAIKIVFSKGLYLNTDLGGCIIAYLNKGTICTRFMDKSGNLTEWSFSGSTDDYIKTYKSDYDIRKRKGVVVYIEEDVDNTFKIFDVLSPGQRFESDTMYPGSYWGIPDSDVTICKIEITAITNYTGYAIAIDANGNFYTRCCDNDFGDWVCANESGISIDDENVTADATWSSEKITNEISTAFDNLTEEQKESLKGDPGEPGPDGKSAYEIWQDMGNSGSERDFLDSFKGEDGSKNIDDENVSTDTTWSSEKIVSELGSKTYTSLDELGLTAPVTVGDIFNAMPGNSMVVIACEDTTDHITDVPMHYGVLTIKKSAVGRFSIDYQNSLASSPCNVKKWIGTLKGDDGTGLYWREVAYKENISIYKSLSELELDTTATLKDITRAMAKSSMIAIKVDAMANQSEYNSITQGTVTIYKIEDARIQAIMTEKSTGRTWIGTLGGENTITGWKELRSDSPFHRIVTQGIAGYFKFKPTSTGIDQPLRISVTDNYGGMINISGAIPSGTQYKPFKCIRLSNGTYADYDAIKTTNNKMEKLYFHDGYFYLKVVSYTTCTFTGLIEAPTYVETFDDTVAEEIPIRSVFDTPYNNGYADPSTVVIGDADSSDGVIKTLGTLGFTGDVMTWDNGEYRVSHVGGLTNLPAEITEEKPGFRLEHHDVKKWGSNHNPHRSTYGCRQSILHYKGNIFVRYEESGATAGVLITDTGWRKLNTNNSTTLVTNTANLKLDVTKKNASWYGAIKLTYLYDTSPVEVEIDFRSVTDTLKWTVSKGQKYVKKVTYTQDASNKAHYTIGVEFGGTTYGCYQAEVIGDFADIISLTKDAFTGDTTAVYGNPYGKNNGVTLVSAPEDLGLTSPCTTVQLVQAMRNTFNKTITSSAIGVFNNGGNTITDAPSDYGLLHIEVFGHDRVMIRYDGISGSSYDGSWIGQVVGSNGAFSSVNWSEDSNSFNKKPVKTATIDLSASDLQSTGSGSVHLSLGNYIDKSAKVIRAEGYYNPPSDSTYPVVIPVVFGSQAGHLTTDSTGYSFRAVQSPSGKTGSGFVKIYYIE